MLTAKIHLEWLTEKCKPNRGDVTCAFLMHGPGGSYCAKDDLAFKQEIEKRLDARMIRARGDYCQGYSQYDHTEAPGIYPEHEKLAKIKDKAQAIGDFLEWLQIEYDHCIAYWLDDELVPSHTSITSLLALHFGIDQSVLEDEKRHMLDGWRQLTAKENA